MPTLVTMSEDSSAAASKEASAAAAAVDAAVAKVDEDFAIWLRLDSKPGKITFHALIEVHHPNGYMHDILFLFDFLSVCIQSLQAHRSSASY